MRSILVVRAGALGDALLTLPALAALRTRWPAARLTLVAPRVLLPFALASGFAEAALPFEGEAGLALSEEGSPLPAWAPADLAIVWLRHWEEAARRLAAAGAANVLGAASQPPPGTPIHVADHLLTTLAPLGLGIARLAKPLRPPLEAVALADQQLSHVSANAEVIAVHPGSGGSAKCWPDIQYRALVDLLVYLGFSVLLCLGPAEYASAPGWRAFAAERSGVTCVVDAPLPVLAAMLQQCTAFVGNDAGVTHLAAALGVPTVALFGPTDPAFWAPLGPHVRVLRDPGWAANGRWALSVAEVETAVLALSTARSGGSRG